MDTGKIWLGSFPKSIWLPEQNVKKKHKGQKTKKNQKKLWQNQRGTIFFCISSFSMLCLCILPIFCPCTPLHFLPFFAVPLEINCWQKICIFETIFGHCKKKNSCSLDTSLAWPLLQEAFFPAEKFSKNSTPPPAKKMKKKLETLLIRSFIQDI